MTISVSELSFSYNEHDVLHDISFTAQNGEVLAVLGPNGVGKSTLFRCILGLLPRQRGTTEINGTDIGKLTAKELARLIAYVPQSHYPAFNFSVMDMVLMGTTAQLSDFSSPSGKEHKIAETALERIGILHLKNRGYMQISGGEQQLVLIARALAQNTKILIMDEPTANLDYGNQLRILTQIRSLAKDGYTILQSMHNPDQAFLYADKVLALSDGKVIDFGTPQNVIKSEMIKHLYHIDVQVESLYEDRFRFCLPRGLIQ